MKTTDLTPRIQNELQLLCGCLSQIAELLKELTADLVHVQLGLQMGNTED